ncbi:MAG: hypothetical protein Tp1123DCM1511741_42 [Prokaryotic dsDNA virus sp.]|nr:MAG: hypothetical protein Tp1123DCM1511741_42 [Prokaryotic dsDNA virus sp.]|tara:strand:- start:9982 stop:10227 length:246 start_codon:yes stop_codon:yes gene_type:complete
MKTKKQKNLNKKVDKEDLIWKFFLKNKSVTNWQVQTKFRHIHGFSDIALKKKKQGFTILDEWKRNADTGARYKLYIYGGKS